MSKSDSARIAIIEETVPGTTPATPAFDVLRLLSDSLVEEATTIESGELAADRGVTDQIIGGRRLSGSIESYMQRNTVYDELMSAAIGAAAYSAGGTVPAAVKRTFTIEKTYLGNAAAPYYHRYTGVGVGGMTIGFAPQQPLTRTFELVGGLLTPDTAIVAGATYVAPSPALASAPVMRAAKAVLSYTGWSAPTISELSAACHTAMQITLSAGATPRECIGRENAEEFELGKLSGTFTATLLLTSNKLLERWQSLTEFGLQIDISDDLASPSQNTYTLVLNRLKLSQVRCPTPAASSDVVFEIEAAILQPTGGDVIDISMATA